LHHFCMQLLASECLSAALKNDMLALVLGNVMLHKRWPTAH